jgi:hypothetical protein
MADASLAEGERLNGNLLGVRPLQQVPDPDCLRHYVTDGDIGWDEPAEFARLLHDVRVRVNSGQAPRVGAVVVVLLAASA